MMTYKGVVKGRIIELEKSLPYQDGQWVSISVESLIDRPHHGSAAAILEAVDQPPHLDSQDVEELERAIEIAKLPVRANGLFEASQ